MIRVALLWHMHQPLYRDPREGEYRLPWVRMHGLKDYYGMVKLVEEFPSLRLTFNLVPSLIAQLDEYAAGTARDPFFEAARTPAADLDVAGRRFLLRYFFQANHTHLIGRYPRYRELLDKYRNYGFNDQRAHRNFSEAELRDLQVLSQLAWFDEYFLKEEPGRRLAAKGRGFDLDDQAAVCAAQAGLLARIVPAYREAQVSGQVELSTSPFYHPILPLLCDSMVAGESHPFVPMPRERFRWPDDARTQLERACELHQRVFGLRPTGLWPSEGSVSDEVIRLAADLGFHWLATDEGVLGRSLDCSFTRRPDGAVDDGERLYGPCLFTAASRPVHLFFRDHQLSDLIGFVYAQMDAEAAADDFLQRIRRAAAPLASAGRDALVPVILDGENAWEYFPQSGRAFLRAVYHRLTHASDVETCTLGAACAQPEVVRLDHVVPGSWINANFDVWLGAEEDNRAWDLLGQARWAWEQARRAETLAPERLELAFESLLAAEGSDWNWWYGPEHHSENQVEFDALFRAHLTQVYFHLGLTPPGSLAAPLLKRQISDRSRQEPASGWVHPRLDGQVSSYFEWLGAAVYHADHRTSAMHGKHSCMAALHAGFDADTLFLRLDFVGSRVPVGEVQFDIGGPVPHLIRVPLVEGRHSPSDHVTHALGKILELAVSRTLLGAQGEGVALQVRATLWIDNTPREALPGEGSLELTLLSQDALAVN